MVTEPSVLLMLQRAWHPGETDEQILGRCRDEIRDQLEEAEMRMWELQDRGWRMPDDDDSITYAMRLLLLVGDYELLGTALRIAREIAIVGPLSKESAT